MTPRARSIRLPAAAIGRDNASRVGAAASVNEIRNGSNTTWSNLPTTIIVTERRTRTGKTSRWSAARRGAERRITPPSPTGEQDHSRKRAFAHNLRGPKFLAAARQHRLSSPPFVASQIKAFTKY